MPFGARAAALFSALALLLALPFAIPACGSSGSAAPGDAAVDAVPADDGAADAGADWLAPPPIARDAGEGQLAPQRAACAFEAGAWPAQTIGSEYPVGADIPINHVIVIMQENRSFDHYLGQLVAQGYYLPGDFSDGGSGFAHNDQLDSPPNGWSNPDSDGGLVTPHADDQHCFAVDHSWNTEHADWDNGKNDHFVLQNEPDGQRTMFYEDDTVIPFYYALASTFGVGDRYFCSVLSSTWPNRFFAMAGTSFGVGDNSFDTLDTAEHPSTQIFTLLEEAGHTWGDYTDGPHATAFFPYWGFQADTRAHLGDVRCNMLAAIHDGTLPEVSYMMGDEVSETSDEGPSNLPGIGGQVVEAILRALFASPLWKDTAVFITYDENGGLADHVPPAPACPPDGLAPHDGKGNAFDGGFDTTGFRVPFIVVSPYAKAHYVSHVVHDHTSILRFIEARFGLPAMSARDANSAPPFEMFDFKNPPFMTPPSITAHTTVDPAVLQACGQALAPTSCK